MSNRNFNKQIVPSRKKLAMGGPATKKKVSMKDMIGTGGTKEMREERRRRFNDKKSPSDMMKRPKPPKGEPMRPLPVFPKKPGEAPKTFPKIPRTPRPTPLTPKQREKLKDMLDKKTGRKKLMGGGSSSSREAMMHGFYNKDMGMGKKKK